LISYELSCGLSLMTIVMLSGSLQLSTIVEQQAVAWNIFRGGIPAIIAFIVYLIAGHAETNRGPFDLPEAESELTAGYHTEYSGIQFGFFYLAEYLNMFIISAIAATIFLGGWMPLHIAGWEGFNEVMDYIPPVLWFFGKTFVCVFLALWVRWTMPRLRIDQLLKLEWKILMPLSLLNIILMAIWILYL
jgi:NADH-quinone oxidoreductase subunit H